MNREFLQLAQNYDPSKHYIGGFYVSHKLDGMRAFWDGGVTRGMACTEVPFANIEKDFRKVKPPISTGLWTRYGKPIQAPAAWLDQLPPIPLDGELYLGPGTFQSLLSVTKTLVPGPEWDRVRFYIFDAPQYQEVFTDGRINNPNFKKVFSDLIPWFKSRTTFSKTLNFDDNYNFFKKLGTKVVVPHEQIRLTTNEREAKAIVQSMLEQVTSDGGEGLMLRAAYSFWVPKRVSTLLKVKKLLDAEATVVGYTWGRETDKGSKLLGLMGAMIVVWQGRRFELSGFTDAERALSTFDTKNPGQIVPDTVSNPLFPRGSKVTFRYRELTNDSIPKEARYWRKA